MIRVNTGGIDAFNRALMLEMARLDREISQHVYAYTVTLFSDLVRYSPQWSGDLASNWRYSIGSPDSSYDELHNKAEGAKHWNFQNVYQRGMDPAVTIAMTRMKSVPQPTWRDTIYFTNNTPIAPYVERQVVKIRPVNLIQGQVAMIDFIYNREQNAGRVL